jgi:hypothetical protein
VGAGPEVEAGALLPPFPLFPPRAGADELSRALPELLQLEPAVSQAMPRQVKAIQPLAREFVVSIDRSIAKAILSPQATRQKCELWSSIGFLWTLGCC